MMRAREMLLRAFPPRVMKNASNIMKDSDRSRGNMVMRTCAFSGWRFYVNWADLRRILEGLHVVRGDHLVA